MGKRRRYSTKDVNWGMQGKPRADKWKSQDSVRFATKKNYKNGERFVELRIQTFKNVDGDWKSRLYRNWHVLAKLYHNRIETWPVQADPTAKDYLKPTNGTVRRISYVPPTPFFDMPPNSPEDAISFIGWVFDPKFFLSCHQGLGLRKIFIDALKMMDLKPSTETLEIHFDGPIADGKFSLRLSEITLAKLEEDYSHAITQWTRQRRSHREDTRVGRLFQAIAGSGADHSSSDRSNSNKAFEFKNLTPSKLDKTMLSVLKEDPEQAWILRSYAQAAILKNMITDFEAMLSVESDSASWGSLFERHIDLVHEVLTDPAHGVRDSQSNQLQPPSDGNVIMTSERLALVIKSPSTELAARIKIGEATVAWSAAADIQSAVSEALECARKSKRQGAKYIVIAGKLPKHKVPRSTYLAYRKSMLPVEIVDFYSLLDGLKRLALKISLDLKRLNDADFGITDDD